MARPGVWDFDTEGDFRVVDGQEVVTVERSKADGTFDVPVPDIGAVREIPRRTSAGFLIEGVDLIWHLDVEDLPGPFDRLSRGDVITDADGVRWVAVASDLAGVLDEWSVPTVKAVERTP